MFAPLVWTIEAWEVDQYPDYSTIYRRKDQDADIQSIDKGEAE
jgi:hypothetical protein